MKIRQKISTPGTALPSSLLDGADMPWFVEFPLCGFARANSLELDGPVIETTGVPPPRCERSP